MKTLLLNSAIIGAIVFGSLACDNNKVNPKSTSDEATTVESTSTHSAKTLPGFKMVNSKGEIVELSQFAGKKLFVNLWASWCPPCRAEMPSIERLYQKVDTSKVAFIMLALDESFEKSLAWANKQKLNLPLFYPAENLPPLFEVDGIPVTFIFNEAGELVHQVEGSDNYNTAAYKKMLD